MNIKPIDLNNAVILDTETTGLDNQAEICEIAVIEAETGKTILDTLIKPGCTIPDEVIRIHGITNDMVTDAPIYSDIHHQLVDIFRDKMVIIYNADFDLRMIRQSSALSDPTKKQLTGSIICAMKWYAEFYGHRSNYRGSFKWQKLIDAARQQHIDVSDLKAHRALADCVITRRTIESVNRKLK